MSCFASTLYGPRHLQSLDTSTWTTSLRRAYRTIPRQRLLRPMTLLASGHATSRHATARTTLRSITANTPLYSSSQSFTFLHIKCRVNMNTTSTIQRALDGQMVRPLNVAGQPSTPLLHPQRRWAPAIVEMCSTTYLRRITGGK